MLVELDTVDTFDERLVISLDTLETRVSIPLTLDDKEDTLEETLLVEVVTLVTLVDTSAIVDDKVLDKLVMFLIA